MRIAGKKLSEPNIEILIIPRGGDNEDIIFKAKAVLDMDTFDKAYPTPSAPMKIVKGGKKVEDVDSPMFKKKVSDHNRRRIGYLIIKSLEATEGLEWETVDLNNPETWENYEKELRDGGFSNIEIMRIIQCVMRANCLDESRLDEARDRFLLTQQAQDTSSSLQEEPNSTLSGVLATDSE